MSIVSHLHQLFNAETCQSYIHALRWKDRPLQCPRCQSHHVGPWGTYHYQPGLKRYRCKEQGCKRTCNLTVEVAVLLTLYVALTAAYPDSVWKTLRRQLCRK
jgi:hypothetical protein